MTELLLEKPYDDITVQAILDRADIGRATFYHHFRDKLDVVDAVSAEMFAGLHDDEAGTAPGGGLPVPGLFRHVAERSSSLRAMLDTPGGAVFWAQSHAALTAAIEGSLAMQGQGPSGRRRPVPAAIEAQFIGGALLGTIQWWLRSGMPYPAERMAEMVRSLLPEGHTGS
jgi:AcrR family transcriptional regulator